MPVTFYVHGLCLVTFDQRAMLIVSGRLPEQQLILVFIPEARFPGHARKEVPVTFYMHGLCLVTSDQRAMLIVSGRLPEQQLILVFIPVARFPGHARMEGPVTFYMHGLCLVTADHRALIVCFRETARTTSHTGFQGVFLCPLG